MSDYFGIIIEESLEDASVLKSMKIISTEIDKVIRTYQGEYEEVREYGISIGIPEHQLVFKAV